MSIQNTTNEIKPLEAETVSYVGEGEVVSHSFFTKFFLIFAIILVVLLLWGIEILINIPKPNVTIEMGQK